MPQITLDLRADIDTREAAGECPRGQQKCCDPVENQIFNSVSEAAADTEACARSNIVATQDFQKGITCGKRDSNVYYNAGISCWKLQKKIFDEKYLRFARGLHQPWRVALGGAHLRRRQLHRRGGSRGQQSCGQKQDKIFLSKIFFNIWKIFDFR